MVDYVFERHLSGGILLPANKSSSTASPIHRGFVPTKLVLALRQHRGNAAEPVVAIGERVLKGQTVAAAAAAPSAAVHAGTSGWVRAIEERPALGGHGVQPSLCIVIETDGRDERVPASAAPAWPADVAAQLEAIRAGGIVGLGGAVFPTADKLATPVPVTTLIVNGAECEPYISCDDMLMRENAAEIVAGTLILTDVLSAPRAIIAIERDKPQAMEAIEAAAQAVDDPRLKLAEVPTIYPAGGEKQLVELLTGEEVPSGRYPGEFGYVCQNVGTAYAVQRLRAHREPLVTRVVTLTGGGVKKPQNVEAPIGTPIAELVALCGGYNEGVTRLIAGGSMMGYALPDDETPITKATNCVIAALADEVRTDMHEWPCIRCGDCAMACPSRLLPQDLLVAATTSDFEALHTLGLKDCIECGCCDVICPSQIMLTERFRIAKRAVAARVPVPATSPGQD
ncbi:MAG TPA: electron transport complex subunit RsxC [Gammaproteobacteria bacterium]|nr:electron transport complex subunit RsxC [Gammaproteobacteria bacterium]